MLIRRVKTHPTTPLDSRSIWRTLVTVAASAALVAGIAPAAQATDPTPTSGDAATADSATGDVSPAATTAAANPPSVAGLDENGTTIPETNYPIPSGAIFMAPWGSDSNSGKAEGQPVKSLNRAVDAVPEGGTIVLRGGTYRDAYTKGGPNAASKINQKALTLQAYPRESPWLDGSDVVPTQNFSRSGQTWSTAWSTPTFCDNRYYERAPLDQNPNNSGPCAHIDFAQKGANDTLPSDPQQVFVNGTELTQVASMESVRANTFYYDWSARKLHIGTDPNGKTIEATARPKALIFGGSNKQARWSLKGIGVRRYASSPMSGISSGAIYFGGGIVTIESSVFTRNAAGGISFDAPQNGSTVSRSVFAYNGDTPLQANGESKLNKTSNFVVQNSLFNRNVWSGLGEGCRQSCAQSGVKMAHMQGFRLTGNLVQNSGGGASGLWCDGLCRNGVYTYNIVRNIGGPGIFHEISDTAIIAGNVVDRAKTGIQVPSANTKVYNNTLLNIDKDVPVRVYDDRRTAATDAGAGPDTRNVEIRNNLMAGAKHHIFEIGPDGSKGDYHPDNTLPSEYFSAFDDNTSLSSNDYPTFVKWKPSLDTDPEYWRLNQKSQFTSKYGWERRSVWSAGTVNDVVPGAPNGDYRVKDNALTRIANRPPLPQDVANALNVGRNDLPLSGAPIR